MPIPQRDRMTFWFVLAKFGTECRRAVAGDGPPNGPWNAGSGDRNH